jgi:hypothetical protein
LASAHSLPAGAQPGSRATGKDEQAATADRLFEEGRWLAKAGRFKEACQRFVQSDALEHTFGTTVNLGDCAERDGQLALAWQRFDDAARTAERDGSRELAKFARDRAAALAPKLCTVVIRIADPAAPGLTILFGDRALQPAAEIGTLVEPGEVSVTISAAKTPPMHQILACAAGAITFVHFPEMAPPVEPATGPVAADATTATARLAEPPSKADDHAAADAPGHGYRVGAVVTGAFAGVALVTGGVLGALADRRQNAAHAECPSTQQTCDRAANANELIRSGHNLAVSANVAFGIGAAAAITSGVLWYVRRKHATSGVAVMPAASPNQVAITALGTF